MDESTVLKKWRDDFDNLLNQENSNIEFDYIFSANSLQYTKHNWGGDAKWGVPGQYI